MKPLLLSLSLISAAILSSCSPVSTQAPVAKKTEISLQKEMEGSWRLGDDGIIHIAFDLDGMGRFACIEWKEKDNKFQTMEGKFNALRSENNDSQGFTSLQLDEDAEDNAFQFGAFKLLESGEVLLWDADSFSAFEPLLIEKEMIGLIQNDNPGKKILFFDGPKLTTKMDDFGKYFDLENPTILTRVVPKKKE